MRDSSDLIPYASPLLAPLGIKVYYDHTHDYMTVIKEGDCEMCP